jgi:hypothetical protein
MAGIAGGIVMFIWNFIAHDVLPLGRTGIHELPNESAIVDTLNTNLGDTRGMFFFPGSGLGPDATAEAKREAMKQNMEKMKTSPSGILIYHGRRNFDFPRALAVELGTDVLEAILVLFLLSSTRLLTAGSRILFVTIAGVLAALSTNVSYWNWYGFPKRYTVAYMFIEIVGFFLIGLVGAMILKNRDPVAEAK